MIKLLLITMLSIQSYAYNNAQYLTTNESQTIICKHGYLVQIRTRVILGKNVTVEQTYCESRSAWNSSCTHEPYKCKN